jgi:hypothetical protein
MEGDLHTRQGAAGLVEHGAGDRQLLAPGGAGGQETAG